MTEKEWFASDDPAAMGTFLAERKDYPRASARVLRLYVAAFWRWQSDRLKTPQQQKLLKKRAGAVEAWADSGAKPKEAKGAQLFVGFNDEAKEGFLRTVRAPGQWGKGGEPAKAHAVALLHEVFGNPFATRRRRKTDPRRGWMFSASWHTDTVLALARQMYDSREFGAMPILADALQDAGCDNDDVLSHCRDASTPHTRGCWVLDLVLEKG
jgi:hypothetical protein